MKKFLLLLFYFLLSGVISAQPFHDTINFPFHRGERLVYNVFYKSFLTGKVHAGRITCEVKNTNRRFDGHNTYHIECIGQTLGAFNWFMKIEDKYESYIDEKSMLPWLFVRQIREGHYKKDEEVQFFPNQNLVISPRAVKKTPPRIQDVVSAFYYSRTTDFSKFKPGENFTVPIFYDDSIFYSTVVCSNREVVRTRMGNINCISFRPMVLVGKVFSSRYPLTIWVTDDENKIPVLARSALTLGRVEIELVTSSGLARPLIINVEEP